MNHLQFRLNFWIFLLKRFRCHQSWLACRLNWCLLLKSWVDFNLLNPSGCKHKLSLHAGYIKAYVKEYNYKWITPKDDVWRITWVSSRNERSKHQTFLEIKMSIVFIMNHVCIAKHHWSERKVKSINQSLNQAINQVSKQAIKHSINQSSKQWSNQSINEAISQPRKQPINQSINQLSNQAINKSINQSIKKSINQSINQAIKQSRNQSINQSIKQSTNQSINQSANQWNNEAINQSSNEAINQSRNQSIN